MNEEERIAALAETNAVLATQLLTTAQGSGVNCDQAACALLTAASVILEARYGKAGALDALGAMLGPTCAAWAETATVN